MDTAVQTEARTATADRERIATAVVDVVLIAGLVLLGRIEHGVNPIAEPIASLETVAPFVIGWAAIAALAGIYTRDRPVGKERLRLTTLSWIAAANVGLMLRASALFDGGATWPFPLVITGFGLIVLLGWRAAYMLYRSVTN
ncbi:DUF3054 domain-containing protein [Natrinema longum]|uniref:DUF3054 domain-containing protein n=1 Tax=Natrinema longum TaxID=370324 RepID=A0A8A2UAA4_9EURY|nr:DUF3054 domain-containing protein [Natrinema longum]MBZ6496539.1 DUF3054 domain-containing protein [Natrinema longum]QSW85557.1 DUF3054 domain-containing protein [Natrinema longum]